VVGQRSIWTLDKATIDKLEASIKPDDFPHWGYVDHPPIAADYARYYAGYMDTGHRMVSGEWVLSEMSSDKHAVSMVSAAKKSFL
jgi:hypothetical protein